ncbi:MAG TPA: hypothetical protein VG518_04335 [Solirubrobacterales bacterium]|nr:hypothetical protein [Solirubrobacterales bacterium]
MRASRLLFAILLLGLALAGCGSSSEESSSTSKPPAATIPSAPPGAAAKRCDTYATDVTALRVTGASCAEARRVTYAWQRSQACAAQSGASRGACSVGSYRCLATRGGRGKVVSCAKADQAISFITRPS